MLILRTDKKFLIGKRGPECRRSPNVWALPGGMIEPGEDVVRALIREVFEETGLAVVPAPVGVGEPPFVSIQPFAVTDHLGPNGAVGENPYAPYCYEAEDHLSLWFTARLAKTGWDVGAPGAEQVPVIMEPGKCLEWRWVTMDDVDKIPGVHDKNAEQYYWLPMDLFRASLKGLFF